MSLHVPPALGEIAVFNAPLAHQAGLSGHDLRTLTADRRIVRLHHGWYTARLAERDEGRHALSALAAVLLMEGRAAASHHSALALRGLPVHACDLRLVMLEREGAAHGRTRAGVVVRAKRAVHEQLATELWPAEIPVVSAADACVQVGLRFGAASMLVSADAVLHRGLATVTDLEAATDRHRGCTGARAVRAAVSSADARHESPGETLTAMALRAIDVPFEPQIWLDTDIGRVRVDFAIEELGVIVEFDGAAKYGDRDDLVAEKRREDAIRALGYVVVRIVWKDLFTPGAIERKIRAARRTRAA